MLMPKSELAPFVAGKEHENRECHCRIALKVSYPSTQNCFVAERGRIMYPNAKKSHLAIAIRWFIPAYHSLLNVLV